MVPFVELEIDDPAGSKHEVHTSPIIMNEPSPRWNVKYDYIMVSATSTLGLVGGKGQKNDGGKQAMKAPKVHTLLHILLPQ